MEKRWTVEEVATDFGVCVRTVRRWIETRDLVAVRIGSLVWILERDLRDFIDRHRVTKQERQPIRRRRSPVTQAQMDAFYGPRPAAKSAASRK